MILDTETNEKITDVLIDIATSKFVVDAFDGDKAKIHRSAGDWRNSLEQALVNREYGEDIDKCLQLRKARILKLVEEWVLNRL